MTTDAPVALSSEDIAELARIAKLIERADKVRAKLYADRLELWRKLLEGGVSKGALARASGITHAALRFQLEKGLG